jgi:hypothetical protein
VKKLISIALCLFTILILAGCTTTKTAAGEIADPGTNEDKAMVGEWTSTDNGLTINRYLYTSGNSITIIQDTEQTFWCYTGNWKQNGNTLDISGVTIYKYNGSSQKWEQQDNSQSENLTSFELASDKNSFTCSEQLMTDSVMTFKYTRGLTKLDIPDINGLTTYIVKVMK